MEETYFRETLIRWYEENGRQLPWRDTRDPYRIWISEVILQQTRVAQGLDYFRRFTDRFPDVASLAAAEEDEVLKYWQGLGYYSRARNLHAAAQEIVSKFDGVFPSGYQDVLSLKGIGEYTAAAICSFAWRQPYAVVDGNVYRVLARVFGVDLPIDSSAGKKYFTELASKLLDRKHPDLYNQAIMDFGALQCVPQSPACLFCPFRDQCAAFITGEVNRLPVKEGKTVQTKRYFNYLYIRYKDTIFLSQRTEKDIWRNLYEFPLVETSGPLTEAELRKHPLFLEILVPGTSFQMLSSYGPVKHVLSHRIVYACFYEIEVTELPESLDKYLRVNENDKEKYAVSRLIDLYLKKKEK